VIVNAGNTKKVCARLAERPKSIDPTNGLDPSIDPGGSDFPKLDTHDTIELLLADRKQRPDGKAFQENRDLADVPELSQYSRRNDGELRLRVLLHLAPGRNWLYYRLLSCSLSKTPPR
jgi:hypothetical protein